MEREETRIELTGRIDSGNAAQRERELLARLDGKKGAALILDAQRLEYISSAGLRTLLRLRREFPDLRIVNVSSQVYEILEMTGLTELMTVEKAYRVLSVEGCEVIGEGFNGRVYRLDGDTVVKVYKNADALAEIRHEREVARLALILGVPTAISYDVVRVGSSYGAVFELLQARSFASILAEEPERLDWCVRESTALLKKIHRISVPAGKLPSMKEQMLAAIRRMKVALPAGQGEKLLRMVEEIPESDRMLHGDYHTKNIVLAGDEVLLIDMDTLSVGHPIFELAQMYNSYVGFSQWDPEIVRDFQGFGAEIARPFWAQSLRAYLGTEEEEKLRETEDKIRCIAYADVIDWKRRYSAPVDGAERRMLELWTKALSGLLERVDSLDFEVPEEAAPSPDELEIEASAENLAAVTAFVEGRLDAAGCSPRVRMQIDLAVEEVFVNIASYAYAPGTGTATVRAALSDAPPAVTITFLDRGKPYDPLLREDPDVTLSAEDREIGGLGVFLTKKLMDEVAYEYTNGQNILTLKKKL